MVEAYMCTPSGHIVSCALLCEPLLEFKVIQCSLAVYRRVLKYLKLREGLTVTTKFYFTKHTIFVRKRHYFCNT